MKESGKIAIIILLLAILCTQAVLMTKLDHLNQSAAACRDFLTDRIPDVQDNLYRLYQEVNELIGME